MEETPATRASLLLRIRDEHDQGAWQEFLSPEQARGKELGPRADLFSLGGVLYAMCTGKALFDEQPDYCLGEFLHVHFLCRLLNRNF